MPTAVSSLQININTQSKKVRTLSRSLKGADSAHLCLRVDNKAAAAPSYMKCSTVSQIIIDHSCYGKTQSHRGSPELPLDENELWLKKATRSFRPGYIFSICLVQGSGCVCGGGGRPGPNKSSHYYAKWQLDRQPG